MSVGDIKGSRRRFKVRQLNGQAPVPKGASVATLIERNRKIALRMANAASKKK